MSQQMARWVTRAFMITLIGVATSGFVTQQEDGGLPTTTLLRGVDDCFDCYEGSGLGSECELAQQVFPGFTIHEDQEAETEGNQGGTPHSFGQCRGDDGGCWGSHSECLGAPELVSLRQALHRNDYATISRIVAASERATIDTAMKAIQVTCKGSRIVGWFKLDDVAFRNVIESPHAVPTRDER